MRARFALLTIAAALAAVAAAPAAHATDADTQFLGLVADLGLEFATPDEAVAAGNNVCDIVAEGSANNVAPAEIRADIISSLLGEGLDEVKATQFMLGAVSAYCPVYDGVVAG
ncbi:DUF732 domain-containing protein [Mycobacterium sp. NAZ190054]|uniref:DUF732 domain-containing protein n=1 Tax=Mycobacterium sp. NAZ190054 TaxID=1747766 RepID=UPI0007999D5C|nr:DUF732 domain-containing protein [Mycobacterium sp. NAZ190054]KWX67147.1 hypothetical protein ASJ79_22695 [Mycobacterium sp. NAZ190054]